MIINANEAREQSKNNISTETEKELRDAEVYIIEAVTKGKTECWCYKYLHEQAIVQLRELGYQVRNCSDQRDGDMFEIKW